MQVYILRHGIAEAAADGAKDAERALVPQGKLKLKTVLRIARAAGVSPTIIASSPYRRALETARIAAKVFEHKDQVMELASLSPGRQPEEVWDDIRELGAEQRIMLAGHEPQLGYLTGFLLAAPSLLIDLKKGSLVRIDMDRLGAAPRGVLRWCLTPKLALGCADED